METPPPNPRPAFLCKTLDLIMVVAVKTDLGGCSGNMQKDKGGKSRTEMRTCRKRRVQWAFVMMALTCLCRRDLGLNTGRCILSALNYILILKKSCK